ncbi:hypothetical protein JD969_10590 [Planctomycetota bacterium]|nr:hypothetical protein JD969_10590 [Planctomycetota bacterium]
MMYIFGIAGIALAVIFNIGWFKFINEQWVLSLLFLGVVSAIPLRFWCPLADRVKPHFRVMSVVVPMLGALAGFVVVDLFYVEWVSDVPIGFSEHLKLAFTERLLGSIDVLLFFALSVYTGHWLAMSGSKIAE